MISGRGLRPAAFLTAMLGFGLRLDTDWQVGATVLLALAGGLALASLRHGGGRAFVPDDERG